MATHALLIFGLPFCAGLPAGCGPNFAAACAAGKVAPLPHAFKQLARVLPALALRPCKPVGVAPLTCTKATLLAPPFAAIKLASVAAQAYCAALPCTQSALLFFVTPAGSAAKVCGQPAKVPAMVPLTVAAAVVVVVFVLAIFKNPCVVLVSGIAYQQCYYTAVILVCKH